MIPSAAGRFPERILVIGSPGAGKTVFARRLHAMTGLPLLHLDMIWHKPDGTHTTREEFDRRLSDVIGTDRWIIDGNYQRTIPMRLRRCRRVYLLDFPTEVCLKGAEERIGKKREDLPWIETEFDEEFRQFILGFREDRLPAILSMLQSFDGELVVLRSREESEQRLREEEARFAADGNPTF